eukprot:g401.t1
MGCVWIVVLCFCFYAMPPLNTLWGHKLMANTWLKPSGDELYDLKTQHWVRSHVLADDCALDPIAVNSTLGGVFPFNTENITIPLATVKARTKAHLCYDGTTGSSAPSTMPTMNSSEIWDDFYAFLENENEARERENLDIVSNETALALFNSRPVYCKCQTVQVDAVVHDEEFYEQFYLGVEEDLFDAVNGWHRIIDFANGVTERNANVDSEASDYAIACCTCASVNDDGVDFCGRSEDKFLDAFESNFRLRPNPSVLFYVGWDMLQVSMVIAIVYLAFAAVGMGFVWKRSRTKVLISIGIGAMFPTLAGDTLWRGALDMTFEIKATMQIITFAVLGIYAGRVMAENVWQRQRLFDFSTPAKYPRFFTKSWYIWSVIGPTLTTAICGPFMVALFVEKTYNAVDTGEGLRLFLATFAIPIVFWLIMTLGRFASGRMCQYGRSPDHPIEVQHNGAIAFTATQFIYAIFARAFVAGTAGASEDVRYSIFARGDLIVASLLSNAIQILARRTTQWRDKNMYYMYFLGQRTIGDEYFRDPAVSRFLERDMLLFEAFFDAMALTYVTFTLFLFDLSLGVDMNLALGAGFVNWLVQMITEQIGNYIIFYLRQRRVGAFTRKHKGEERDSAASLSPSSSSSSSSAGGSGGGGDVGGHPASELTGAEAAFGVSRNIARTLLGAWYVVFFMAFFGYMVASTSGGAYTRATLLYYRGLSETW